MIKTKVVHIDELYNFLVDDFFHLKSVLVPKLFWMFSYCEIQILIRQTNSYRERTNTKVLDLDESYNLLVDDFFTNRIFIMIYILK
jgi:hypothetical protein